MNETWSLYVSAVSNGAPQKEIVARTGISQSTVSRWLKGRITPKDAGTLAAFATAYDRNPLEAFVVAGVLELGQVAPALDFDALALLADLGFGETPAQGDDSASA